MRYRWLSLALLVLANASQAQEMLQTDGFGSLSGKVTFVGKVPPAENGLWVIDPKTKAVKNVMIWVKPPAGTYLDTHANFKVRKGTVFIDQANLAFTPRVSAINPVYFDGKKMVETGQKLTIRNRDKIVHNVKVSGVPEFDEGFNVVMLAGTEITKSFSPQKMPLLFESNLHPYTAPGLLFVFDHPYYALTKADGTFEIPFVPAGAELYLMARHEGAGWVNGKRAGIAFSVEKNKKLTFNIELEAK